MFRAACRNLDKSGSGERRAVSGGVIAPRRHGAASHAVPEHIRETRRRVLVLGQLRRCGLEAARPGAIAAYEEERSARS